MGKAEKTIKPEAILGKHCAILGEGWIDAPLEQVTNAMKEFAEWHHKNELKKINTKSKKPA